MHGHGLKQSCFSNFLFLWLPMIGEVFTLAPKNNSTCLEQTSSSVVQLQGLCRYSIVKRRNLSINHVLLAYSIDDIPLHWKVNQWSRIIFKTFVMVFFFFYFNCLLLQAHKMTGTFPNKKILYNLAACLFACWGKGSKITSGYISPEPRKYCQKL